MYTGRGTVEKRLGLGSLVEFLRSTLQETSVGWKYFYEVSAFWNVYFLYLKFQKTQSNSVKRVHVFAAHQMALFSKKKTNKKTKNPKQTRKTVALSASIKLCFMIDGSRKNARHGRIKKKKERKKKKKTYEPFLVSLPTLKRDLKGVNKKGKGGLFVQRGPHLPLIKSPLQRPSDKQATPRGVCRWWWEGLWLFFFFLLLLLLPTSTWESWAEKKKQKTKTSHMRREKCRRGIWQLPYQSRDGCEMTAAQVSVCLFGSRAQTALPVKPRNPWDLFSISLSGTFLSSLNRGGGGHWFYIIFIGKNKAKLCVLISYF